MKRRIAVVGAVVLLAAGLGVVGIWRIQRARASSSTPQTVQVRRGSLVATINTAGTVQAAGAVDLVFQAAGVVKEIKVAEGEQVKAGQEIARLVSTDVELQVAQAELNLSNARANLDALKKGASAEEIVAARAALASAQENLKALQAGPSATDVEVARLKWEQAKDSLWSAQSRRDATCGRGDGTDCVQAQAAVASAEMGVEIARLQYEQAQQGASAKELRAAEAQVAQAQLNLSKLTAGATGDEVRTAEAQVKQAELSLEQARLKLAQCSLTAPFDGTITKLSLKVGQTVGASTQAATLTGAGGLEVAADLSEIDIARIQVGQEATIVLDAVAGSTFKGRVVEVARTGTATQGVVNFPVTIRVEQADAAIKPGMTANVSIVVERRDDVLLVPSRAIQTQGKQRIVRVLHEGQIIEVPVQVGLSGDNGVEILSDSLREGDQVVLNTTAATGTVRNAGMGPGSMPGGLGGIMMPR